VKLSFVTKYSYYLYTMSELESDGSDSDYCPDDELCEGTKQMNDKMKELSNYTHNAGRKRKICDIFDEMKANDENTLKLAMSKSFRNTSFKIKNNISQKNKNENEIKPLYKKVRDSEKVVEILSDTTAVNISKDLIREYAKTALRNRTVVEIRKFAGQIVELKHTIPYGDNNTETVAIKPVNSGIDKVLADMKEPQSVSTVAKSALDWNTYKEKEGLDEELAGASKDGYLHRQDFLQRCDFKEHENELASRATAKISI
jgi:uncharacterized protein YeeX (DUF496 family)